MFYKIVRYQVKKQIHLGHKEKIKFNGEVTNSGTSLSMYRLFISITTQVDMSLNFNFHMPSPFHQSRLLIALASA
jgi:hypothetical protein